VKIIKFIFILVLLTFITTTICFGYVENEIPTQILRVGFDPNLPPYQFYENGVYKGFNIDLMNKVARDNHIELVMIPMSLNECLIKFKNQEIDMIMGIRYINELDEVMDVSDSLVQSTISIAMLKRKADWVQDTLNVAPLIIAVERGSIEYEFVKNIKKANYNVAFNQESVIELLLMKRADMIIGVRHVLEYALDKNNLTEQYIISNSFETPVNYYLGLQKENGGLTNIINLELRKLKINGEYEEVYNKWINDKTIENQRKTKRNLWLMSLAIVVVLLVLFAVAYINMNLKNMVEEKTKELSDSNNELQKKILEIRNSNELKNLISESSPRSIVIFDNAGKISTMNENCLKICGCTNVPIGESVYDYSPINMMLENNIERVLNFGESYMGKEMEYETKERKWTFRYVIYPLNDYEKKTRGAIITIEDVTDEKIYMAQAAEKEKNRALIQIISGIAHEIRNPLTSIKAYVELLPRKRDNLEFQKQITAVVPREVERVNTLIENLINYAKPRTRNVERVQVREIIESCVLLSKPVISGNRIKLKINVDNNLYIKVDKNQINQVLLNLLLNAIDAIDEMKNHSNDNNNFEIEINSWGLGNKVYISVKDNGVGMTIDELKNVYELFYTTKVKGSGIGLPLSKQIVEDNDGKIEIESKKYKCTKIIITFKGDFYE
jgi:polar amino acid transport system substrate-binding protein